MSAPRWTPGPWVWETIEAPDCATEHTLRGPAVLCRWWHNEEPPDARLIALAPEMAEILLLLMEPAIDHEERFAACRSLAQPLLARLDATPVEIATWADARAILARRSGE